MKRLLLILLVIGSFPLSAQDPELFQTWYLYEYDPDHIPIIVADIHPPIDPHLTIAENLEFNGTGACNSFNGLYTVPFEGALQVIVYAETSDDCGFQSHNSFESQYFSFMANGFKYEITEIDGGLLLELYSPLGYSAKYRNYPLSSTDNPFTDITLYPNPGDTEIFIHSDKSPVTKLELHNFLGERISIPGGTTASVDISNLASGIYLLHILTEGGTAVKKIIKK